MAWSKPQRKRAAQAAREAGRFDDRELLFRQLSGRAFHAGRLTSTAPGLTNADFEWFMAQLELSAGHGLCGQGYGYWQRAAQEGGWKRLHFRASDLAERVAKGRGKAYAVGVAEQAVGPFNGDLDNLDEAQLRRVIDALSNVLRRGHETASTPKAAEAAA
ncbi:MAG: hypothetical protein AAGE65_03620 [Planctomycetota bacterium]